MNLRPHSVTVSRFDGLQELAAQPLPPLPHFSDKWQEPAVHPLPPPVSQKLPEQQSTARNIISSLPLFRSQMAAPILSRRPGVKLRKLSHKSEVSDVSTRSYFQDPSGPMRKDAPSGHFYEEVSFASGMSEQSPKGLPPILSEASPSFSSLSSINGNIKSAQILRKISNLSRPRAENVLPRERKEHLMRLAKDQVDASFDPYVLNSDEKLFTREEPLQVQSIMIVGSSSMMEGITQSKIISVSEMNDDISQFVQGSVQDVSLREELSSLHRKSSPLQETTKSNPAFKAPGKRSSRYNLIKESISSPSTHAGSTAVLVADSVLEATSHSVKRNWMPSVRQKIDPCSDMPADDASASDLSSPSVQLSKFSPRLSYSTPRDLAYTESGHKDQSDQDLVIDGSPSSLSNQCSLVSSSLSTEIIDEREESKDSRDDGTGTAELLFELPVREKEKEKLCKPREVSSLRKQFLRCRPCSTDRFKSASVTASSDSGQVYSKNIEPHTSQLSQISADSTGEDLSNWSFSIPLMPRKMRSAITKDVDRNMERFDLLQSLPEKTSLVSRSIPADAFDTEKQSMVEITEESQAPVISATDEIGGGPQVHSARGESGDGDDLPRSKGAADARLEINRRARFKISELLVKPSFANQEIPVSNASLPMPDSVQSAVAGNDESSQANESTERQIMTARKSSARLSAMRCKPLSQCLSSDANVFPPRNRLGWFLRSPALSLSRDYICDTRQFETIESGGQRRPGSGIQAELSFIQRTSCYTTVPIYTSRLVEGRQIYVASLDEHQLIRTGERDSLDVARITLLRKQSETAKYLSERNIICSSMQITDEKVDELIDLQTFNDGYEVMLLKWNTKDDNLEGYWELNQELGTVLRFDYEEFNARLINSGLKSFGVKTAEDIRRLCATLFVLATLLVNTVNCESYFLGDKITQGANLVALNKNLKVSPEYTSLPSWIQRMLPMIYFLHIPLKFVDRLMAATNYAVWGIMKYPLVCSTLGLARSWEQFMIKLLSVEAVFRQITFSG